MAKMSNELKIGITVLVAIFVAFVGFRIMKDIPLFKTSTTINTKFNQVNGLIPGNVVYIKGFKIGSVKRMELLPSDSTLAVLTIDEEYSIPEGSIAVLKSSGVLGGRFIEIVKSDSKKMVENGGEIPGVFEEGVMDSFADEGAKLSEDISASIKGIQQLTANLNATLSAENSDNISQIIRSLQNSAGTLNNLIENRKNDLDSMIGDAKNTLATLDDLSSENKENLNTIILNLENTSNELETLSTGLNETNSTLNEILLKVNNGDGSIGKFINDPSLYNNVDSLSFNLNKLIQNINNEPGKYLKHMRLVEVF